MSNKELIKWAIVGFALGFCPAFPLFMAYRLGIGGPVAIGGLCAALLPLFVQISRFKRTETPKKIKPRSNTQVSWEDRIERFSKNVVVDGSELSEASKMELWVASEAEERTPTPPRPVGIIRRLLIRIQKVLIGKK